MTLFPKGKIEYIAVVINYINFYSLMLRSIIFLSYLNEHCHNVFFIIIEGKKGQLSIISSSISYVIPPWISFTCFMSIFIELKADYLIFSKLFKAVSQDFSKLRAYWLWQLKRIWDFCINYTVYIKIIFVIWVFLLCISSKLHELLKQ